MELPWGLKKVQRIKEIKEPQQKMINTQTNNTAQPIMINAIARH
jgi:hypothetical protein